MRPRVPRTVNETASRSMSVQRKPRASPRGISVAAMSTSMSRQRNPSAAFSSAVTSTVAACLASVRATPSRFTTAAAFFVTSPSRTTP